MPAFYNICLQGQIDPSWADSVNNMQIEITRAEGIGVVTTLSGELPDQSALAGVLNLAFMLGLTVISVNRSEMPLNHLG
jgi:hypothetical protein